MITLVKITGAIVAEVGSSYLLVQAHSIVAALISFMGMAIVANIDNIMAHTVSSFNIGEELANKKIQYKASSKKSIYADIEEMNGWIAEGKPKLEWIPGVIMLILNRIMTLTFICVYFYFSAFMILLFLEVLKYRHPEAMSE